MDTCLLVEEIRSGKITPAQTVSDALERIRKENVRLNAASEILEDDALRQVNNLPDGPLKGVPISIKECYALTGKQITSGSKRMPPIHCDHDAEVVSRLKAAGAIVIARGNTSEFLLGRETDNLLTGTTNNAINPDLTAGGSSGGDAALVAAGCVSFAIGTDIGGSVRYPALFNGIVGFKPASGQISKAGIFPSSGNEFNETMNSPGILSRSVRDARLVYNLIGNKELKKSSLENAKIFTSKNFAVDVTEKSISHAMAGAMSAFSSIGLTHEDLDVPDAAVAYKYFIALMCGGFNKKIYEWSTTAKGERLSIIAELLRRVAGRPTISWELFSMLIPFSLYAPRQKKLQKIIAATKRLREKYYSILGNNGILMLPTAGLLAPKHKKFVPVYNKPGVIKVITPVSFCNVLNLSCVTIPSKKYQAGKDTHPPGVQLICAPGNESMLLDLAEFLEGKLN